MTVTACSRLSRIVGLSALCGALLVDPGSATPQGEIDSAQRDEVSSTPQSEVAPNPQGGIEPGEQNERLLDRQDQTASSVITTSDIDASIARAIDAQEAHRDVVTQLLDHPEVVRIAGSAGIDLERARRNAATLSGSELEELAARAAHAQSELAGGDTIVISATAVIIVLLLLILLTD